MLESKALPLVSSARRLFACKIQYNKSWFEPWKAFSSIGDIDFANMLPCEDVKARMDNYLKWYVKWFPEDTGRRFRELLDFLYFWCD